jgi:hypothetical protein
MKTERNATRRRPTKPVHNRKATRPSPETPAAAGIEFEQLKERLLVQSLSATYEKRYHTAFRLAANEAAALAWDSGYPLLTLPVLLHEKVQAARWRVLKQQDLRVRTSAPVPESNAA